jgi:hypothetical protein
MVAHKTVDELREELLRGDDDVERLRREAAHVRREIAERRDAPRDPKELSVALSAAEEQEAIIAWLVVGSCRLRPARTEQEHASVSGMPERGLRRILGSNGCREASPCQ